MSELLRNTQFELPSDNIIRSPGASWDTQVHLDRNPNDTWQLVSRIGLISEGGVGWFVPKEAERWLPKDLHSIDLLHNDELPRQRKVGDILRDFPKDSVARVAEVDHESRTLALDCLWPANKKRLNDFHYSWTIRIDPSEHGSNILTRIRIANPKNPRITNALGSRLDQWAMKHVARGLAQRIPSGTEEPLANDKSKNAARIAIVAGLVTNELMQRSGHRSVRLLGSLTGIASGIAIGYELGQKRSR